jgi:hypothetical protein
MEKFHLELFFQLIGIGASSGLLYHDTHLFQISNNSSFLYQYSILEKELTKIKLHDYSSDNIPKSLKPDLEAICQVDHLVYIFGSGSTSKRKTAFTYNLDSKQTNELNLIGLFEKITNITSIDSENLNIEGVIPLEKEWLFFQRGNGISAQNGIIRLTGKLENPSEITFIPIQLPSLKHVPATFTDAVLVKETIYFLASAEDSNSTYADGDVYGSLVGAINLSDLEILFTQQISEKHKFEGITLYEETEKEIHFLLCEDQDTESQLAEIYKLTIKKTTQ